MPVAARNERVTPTIFGLAEPQLLAVALAVAALRVLGKVPVAGTSLGIDLTVAPAAALRSRA